MDVFFLPFSTIGCSGWWSNLTGLLTQKTLITFQLLLKISLSCEGTSQTSQMTLVSVMNTEKADTENIFLNQHLQIQI